jgi:hypothetical protein
MDGMGLLATMRAVEIARMPPRGIAGAPLLRKVDPV